MLYSVGARMFQCNQKTHLAACHKESQTCERGGDVKRKRFIQMPPPGRMVDSYLKGHLPFLLKPMILIGLGRRRLFPLSNYLTSFLECLGPVHSYF